MGKEPGDRQFENGVSPRSRELDEPLHNLQLLRRDPVASSEAAVGGRFGALPVLARQKPAREWEVGQKSETQLAAGVEDTLLRIAVQEAELVLYADEPRGPARTARCAS